MKNLLFKFTLTTFWVLVIIQPVVFSQNPTNDFLDWNIRNSDQIFEGKIIHSESFLADNGDYLLTKHKVEVSKIFKGEIKQFIEIMTLGGVTDDLIQEWTHTTQFAEGMEGMFFGKLILEKDFSKTSFLLAYGTNAFIEYSPSLYDNHYPQSTKMKYSEIYSNLYEPMIDKFGLNSEFVRTNSIENFLIDNDLGLEFISNSDVLIEFSFDNIQFDGIDIVEFDVMCKSSQDGIKFSASDVYLTYSTEAFGANVVANEKIEATKEVIVADNIYTLSLADEAPEIVKFLVESSSFQPNQLYTLSTIFEKFVHVKISVESLYELASISFDGDLMSNQSYFYDDATGEVIGFDKVAVADPFYSFITTTVTSFSPNPVRAGTGDTLYIVGEDFGTMKGDIIFQNADTGGFGLAGEMTANDMDVVWTDTLIKVKVPSLETNGNKVAGSGSVYIIAAGGLGRDTISGLEIEFAARNIRATSGESFRTYLADDLSGDGIVDSVLLFRPSQSVLDSNNMAESFIRQAMCEWTMSTGIQIDLGIPFASASIPSNTNGITFTNTSVISTASAGVTNVQISTCVDNGQNPPERRDYTRTIDIFLKADLTTIPGANLDRWYFGNGTPSSQELDFHSVILHEFGHVSNLKHAMPSSKVMYYFLGGGTTRRNLSTADINGGNYALDATEMFFTGIGQCPAHVKRGVGCLTAAFEIVRPELVDIFPNPTNNSFRLVVNGLQNQPGVIKLSNLLGQQVKLVDVDAISDSFLQKNVDISDLSRGVYFITLEQDTEYFLGKIIKI